MLLYACESWIPTADFQREYKHENKVLPQDTTHLIQIPCYQRGSPCQDPAGNLTTRRPRDHRKKTQTAVVWSYLLFIRSGQNYLSGTVKGEKDKADRERGGKTTSGNGQAWSSPSPREQWRTGLRRLVIKSFVVPQRPSRLRNRYC